jgi:integrase
MVFGNRKGGPLRESKVLTKVLQPAAVDAGLGRVTWHQFRHIHSSLLNYLNVPSKIAQEQLGHASISTTLGIYNARNSGVTSSRGRSGGRAIVRAIALECSRIRERAFSRQA